MPGGTPQCPQATSTLPAAALEAHLSILLLQGRLTYNALKAQAEQTPACCSTKQHIFHQKQFVQLRTAKGNYTKYNSLIFRGQAAGLPGSLSAQLIPTIC